MKYDNEWYKSLKKPKIQPNAKVFPIVWGILYLLMAFAFFLIVTSPLNLYKIVAIMIFGVQLGINLMWTRVFFIEKNLKKSYELTIFLVIYLGITIFLFYQVSTLASVLMLPCFCWCFFAVYLMYKIYKLNS